MAPPNAASPTPKTVPPWRLRLLGPPALLAREGGRVLPLRSKDAALLAVVALSGPVAAERVAGLLWPGAGARQADTSLRQRLFRLRRDSGAALVDSGAWLQLAPDLDTDLGGALALLAEDENAGRMDLMGELDFEDLPELSDWLRARRVDWQERRDEVMAHAAAGCESAGAIARGLVYAQRLLDSAPLAEHSMRRLMRLHYLRGDRAAAILAFERFEQRLKDELGTRPSAETIELMATIERGATQLPTRRAVAPVGLLRPPGLVGRAADWRSLEHAWSAGRVFLLVGEAGIGKSRLMAEFVAGRTGVVSVQGRPGDSDVAYALLARLLRAVLAAQGMAPAAPRARELALVLPELGPAVALAGQAQRLLLLQAVQGSLAAAVDAGLQALILDDLHCADAASLAFLQSLVLADELSGLRWGLAQRPADGVAALAALRHALQDLGRVEVVTLRALDLADMAALVASLGVAELDPSRLAPALLRHTGGNPLFALETLKDLLLTGQVSAVQQGARLPQPVTVGALVQRRLAQLSVPASRLARTAALAGPDFSAALAAAVLEAHPLDIAEPWRELEAAQVLRDGSFAHDLVFEATLSSVPGPIAQLLHLRIARHLQKQQATPERLAPHWAGACEWRLAGQAYSAAARRARSASQRQHEVDAWRHAAEAHDQAGDSAEAFEARCESVEALIVVQGVQQAQAVIATLLAAASSDGQRAAALTAKATAALMAADREAGLAAAEEAAALARHFSSPWPGFDAARLRAVALAQGGRTSEALAVIEPCRALVDSQGTTEQRGRFWSDYAYVLNVARRLRDTAFALQQALEHAQALGDIAEQATLTSNLATVQGNLGQVPEALLLAQRSLALQAQLGRTDGPEGAVVQTYAGLYCGMVGRYTEALQHLDSALACFARDGQTLWTAVASNHKAQLLIDPGQFARARQALVYEAAPIGHVRARSATIAARVERALGQSGQAEIGRALQELTPQADPHVRMHVLLECALGEPPAQAMAHCDEALQLARQLGFAGVALKASLLHARALSQSGERALAAQAMHGLVVSMEQGQPADLYLGQAWWLAAQVFDANGDGDQALMALARGATWVRRTALPQVPEAFRDSFLHRNPSNRALLAAADLGRAR